MAGTVELYLADEAATAQLGEDLALGLKAGDVLALQGDLGTGKTTLARALIRAMAGDPALEVPSPTYTLVQSYDTRIPIHHFDLYRLSSPEELTELGLDEALATGIAVIEWPERAELPANAIVLELSHRNEGRQVRIAGPDASIAQVERTLAIRDFLETHGWGAAERRHLLGDASARSYETAHLPGEKTRIVMNSPPLALGPPVKDGKPYAIIAHSAQTVSAFVAIDHLLKERGVTVPDIYAADLEKGFLMIGHLGTRPFLADGSPVPERYQAAAELLAAMHGRTWPTEIEAGGARHIIFPFDRDAKMIEVGLLVDWYLPYMTGAPASQQLRNEFENLWNTALDRIDTTETSLLMRDFHSPNIIWRPEMKGHDRLGVLDFQDAMIGPTAYDLASLAMDARVTIPPELERSTVAAYKAARRAAGDFDEEAFDLAYCTMAAHRNSKILGGFVRLDRRDGKPFYLKHLPRIRDYVRRALMHPALQDMKSFYEANHLLAEERM